MKKLKNNFCCFGLGLIASLASLAAFGLEHELKISEENFKNLGVSLSKPESVQAVPLFYAPAIVVIPAAHDFIVSTSQAGLVTQLTASVGDHVKKGQSLGTIKSSELLALQAQYLNANNSLKLAATASLRDKKLHLEGVIPERRAQESNSQHNSALFHANEARQMLEIAGMSAVEITELDQTQKLQSEVTVRSPATGVILERMSTIGTRIDQFTPLYRIGRLDELWLEINIPQEHLADIKEGDNVLVENSPIKAKISMLGHSVNPENQTVMARALIQGVQKSLRPGQKFTVKVEQTSAQPVFKIPNTAIAQNEGKSFIFVRNSTGFLVTPVEVVGKQGAESIVSGALNSEDALAVTGAVALKATWMGLGSSE